MALPTGWQPAGQQLESGQAWVYPVTRPGSSERHALKILKNPARRARFDREVATMRGLVDRGVNTVPPVIEHGEHRSRPYYITPWYPEVLEDLVDGGRFKGDFVAGLDLLIEIAGAVEEVHSRNVAHRDLKPANIFRDERGRVYLGDFGLCLNLESVVRLTDTEEAVGSRLYIAPENESGISEAIDQRPADFYAFGKILWAVLAGRQPPAREQVLRDEYLLSAVTGDERLRFLDPLIAALLDTDPASRLRDWKLVKADLLSIRRVLSGEASPTAVAVPRGSIENARRVAQLPRLRAAKLDEEKLERDAKRRGQWEQRLVDAAEEEVGAIRPALASLTEAAEGILFFGVSTTSPPSLSPADEERFLPKPPEGYTSMSTGPLANYSITADDRVLPDMHLTVYFRRTEDRAWFVRIPTIKGNQQYGQVPQWLLEKTAKTAGPFPLFLHHAVDDLREMLREANSLFRTVCDRYLAIVAVEGDPADAAAWGDPSFDLSAERS